MFIYCLYTVVDTFQLVTYTVIVPTYNIYYLILLWARAPLHIYPYDAVESKKFRISEPPLLNIQVDVLYSVQVRCVVGEVMLAGHCFSSMTSPAALTSPL